MNPQKIRRLNRIFRLDGKALIVAMDHGGFFGPQPGNERPGETIRKVVAGGADAIMTTFGLATTFPEELAAVGLILRADGGVSRLGGRKWRGRLLFGPEEALRLGADGVVCMGFPGAEREHDNLSYLAQLSARCNEWGLPLMAEMLPRGFEGGEDSRTVENIRMVVRIGAELGADIIKTQYTGSVDTFKAVTESCYVPVVILGGTKMDTDGDVLRTVREAMDGGARGVAMGRNIWGHDHPEKMTAAVAAIIHEDATVETALEKLR